MQNREGAGYNIGTVWYTVCFFNKQLYSVYYCCRNKDWKEAAYWYDLAINTEEPDENGEFDATMDNPIYQLQAAQAEMWREGGFGLEKDPSYAGRLTLSP